MCTIWQETMTAEGFECKGEDVSIVFLGRFNPAIFHPLWLAGNNLIRKEEAESGKIDVIHAEAAVFRTEWLILQCTTDQLSLVTFDPTKYAPLRDLAVGICKVLEHTPIRA